MTYARIVNDAIDTIGRLPNAARRLDTQEWVLGLDTAPPELVAATGWYEVVDTDRPDDTDTTTHDHSIELVDGTPTAVWTERAKTQAELAGEQQQANRTLVEQGIIDALSRLDTLIAAPDVDTVPAGTLTTAQLSNIARAMRTAVQQNRDGAQEVAQVLKRTIRLVRGDFDGTD